MRALAIALLLAGCGDDRSDRSPPVNPDALACSVCPSLIDPATCTRYGTCDCELDAGVVACSWRAR